MFVIECTIPCTSGLPLLVHVTLRGVVPDTLQVRLRLDPSTTTGLVVVCVMLGATAIMQIKIKQIIQGIKQVFCNLFMVNKLTFSCDVQCSILYRVTKKITWDTSKPVHFRWTTSRLSDVNITRAVLHKNTVVVKLVAIGRGVCRSWCTCYIYCVIFTHCCTIADELMRTSGGV